MADYSTNKAKLLSYLSTRNMNIHTTLNQYGLSDEEVKVYLVILENGGSFVSKISQLARIKRTTVYLIVDRLSKKNLINKYPTKKGLKIVASDPNILFKRSKKIHEDIIQILPSLKAIEKRGIDKPNVKYFSGEEGFIYVCEESIKKPSSEVLFLGSLKDLYATITDEYDQSIYIPTRLKKKINIKMLVFEDEYTKKLEKVAKKELREIRFLSKHAFSPSSMFIYGNTVALFTSKKELMAVVVESEDLAIMEKNKFNLLWRQAT